VQPVLAGRVKGPLLTDEQPRADDEEQEQRKHEQSGATGGDAEWIISGIGEAIAVDPDLTLHGLRIVGNLHS